MTLSLKVPEQSSENKYCLGKETLFLTFKVKDAPLTQEKELFQEHYASRMERSPP